MKETLGKPAFAMCLLHIRPAQHSLGWELLFHFKEGSRQVLRWGWNYTQPGCVRPLRPAGLTQFCHRLNVIAAVPAAGVFFMEGSAVELLTLHTLPGGERTQQLKQRRNIRKYTTPLESTMELGNEVLLTLANPPWI